MKSMKKFIAVFLGAAVLTVGLSAAKVNAAPLSPQNYWVAQQADQNQTVPNTQPSVQQGSAYYPNYGNGYNYMNPGYRWNNGWWNNSGNARWSGYNGWGMGQSGWWCW
ncbi:hypothetical protein Desdi_1380 [Desulfitobacterium dichloroeliminans LMG P-21439]|uniref:RSAM-associated Gly-rich repeat protein n=1 Tax=Desulfitobacterium dichloroeliminans (strain LMG P-21439 / DCA1) TaxID=871963 RepID=L0F779_DESDL|nr:MULTISPECIES: hypothetical protein [Desulfitobacteriaceae]AGA68885.1 hypothetical protein Desdi_1380 [Desulfitobacterium dichloroeliminans LMG P-21439]